MNISYIFLLIILLTECCVSIGCVVYPELATRGMGAPRSERCGDCHRDIYQEWKDSPHARSFTNAAFKEETYEYQFIFCLGCHAPETIYADGKIEPRTVNREEGVNCNGCHLNSDCKLSGPTPARGPHPIAEKNPFFRTSDACGKCHISTFKIWQELGDFKDKKTCQDCHMPTISRKLIQDEPWQKIYPKRMGKQHLFSFQPMINKEESPLTLAFTKVVHSDGNIEGTLEIENTSIHHNVPTGDYGYREVTVTIEIQDESGQMKSAQNESLFVEKNTALPYREKREFSFCFPWDGKPVVIKATVQRTSFKRDKNILLAEKIYQQ